MKKLTEGRRITIILLFGLLALSLITMFYSSAEKGLVSGKCYKYTKNFEYVEGAEICPVTIKGKKVEVISPTSYPKLMNQKINFISKNGLRDIAVVSYLMMPIFLGLSQIPLLVMGVYLRSKKLPMGRNSELYKNILFYVFIFAAAFSLSSLASFFYL